MISGWVWVYMNFEIEAEKKTNKLIILINPRKMYYSRGDWKYHAVFTFYCFIFILKKIISRLARLEWALLRNLADNGS